MVPNNNEIFLSHKLLMRILCWQFKDGYSSLFFFYLSFQKFAQSLSALLTYEYVLYHCSHFIKNPLFLYYFSLFSLSSEHLLILFYHFARNPCFGFRLSNIWAPNNLSIFIFSVQMYLSLWWFWFLWWFFGILVINLYILFLLSMVFVFRCSSSFVIVCHLSLLFVLSFR